jgi:hypothetical protein
MVGRADLGRGRRILGPDPDCETRECVLAVGQNLLRASIWGPNPLRLSAFPYCRIQYSLLCAPEPESGSNPAPCRTKVERAGPGLAVVRSSPGHDLKRERKVSKRERVNQSAATWPSFESRQRIPTATSLAKPPWLPQCAQVTPGAMTSPETITHAKVRGPAEAQQCPRLEPRSRASRVLPLTQDPG